MKPAAFALPQVNEASISAKQLEKYKSELISAMPVSEVPENGLLDAPASLDPYWENTIAKITEDEKIQLSYVIPDYLSLNFCSDKYMKQCIKNKGFSSRYIMVKSGTELDELCSNKYKLLWEGIDHSIYDSRVETAE